jgi:hypothetical protein
MIKLQLIRYDNVGLLAGNGLVAIKHLSLSQSVKVVATRMYQSLKELTQDDDFIHRVRDRDMWIRITETENL